LHTGRFSIVSVRPADDPQKMETRIGSMRHVADSAEMKNRRLRWHIESLNSF